MLVNRLLIVLAMSIGIGCVSPRTTPRQPPPAKKKAPPAVSELIPKITDRNSKFKADPRYRGKLQPLQRKTPDAACLRQRCECSCQPLSERLYHG